jgi:hypothetical protein
VSRPAIPPNVTLSKFPVETRSLRQETPVREVDYLEATMWFALGVFIIQALSMRSAWGLAWVGLGVWVLLLKRFSKLPYDLVIEAFVFHAIVSYSVVVLLLTHWERVYDLEFDSHLQESIWVAWGGVATFLLGLTVALTLKHGERRSRGGITTPILVSNRQAIRLIIFGFICSEFLASLVPGSLKVVIVVFSHCAPLGLFILAKNQMDVGSPSYGTFRFWAWLATLAFWTIRSMRDGIFGSTLMILALFAAQFSRGSKLLYLSLLLAAAVFAPLLQDVKTDYRRGTYGVVEKKESDEARLGNVFAENFKKVFIEGGVDVYKQGIIQLCYRVCTFDVWYRVKRHMDTQQDFAGGQTVYDALITSFVPRILWKEKPHTGGSSYLANRYADMMTHEGTSVSVGVISELYINGGSWALFLGMFALGHLSGMILNRALSDVFQPLAFFMGISCFSVFVRPEISLSDLLGGLIRLTFVWILVRWFMLKRNRAGGERLVRQTSIPNSPQTT